MRAFDLHIWIYRFEKRRRSITPHTRDSYAALGNERAADPDSRRAGDDTSPARAGRTRVPRGRLAQTWAAMPPHALARTNARILTNDLSTTGKVGTRRYVIHTRAPC